MLIKSQINLAVMLYGVSVWSSWIWILVGELQRWCRPEKKKNNCHVCPAFQQVLQHSKTLSSNMKHS